MTAIEDEYQYLPAFMLVKISPLGDGASASLARARQIVANESSSTSRGDSRGAERSRIRNAVHNLLSRDVINMIDRYESRYGYDSEFAQVRSILREYYSIGADKIMEKALNLGWVKTRASRKEPYQYVAIGNQPAATNIYFIAKDILGSPSASLAQLLALSSAGAALRESLKTVPFDTRAENFSLLGRISQYLNSRLTDIAVINSPDVAKAVLNNAYIEGFVTKKHLDFYMGKINDAGDNTKAAYEVLEKIPPLAQANLTKAFSLPEEHPALAQWIEVEPQMESFIDNTMKSSSINTLSVTATRVAK